MKKAYEIPEIEISLFHVDDIVTGPSTTPTIEITTSDNGNFGDFE